MLDTNKEIILPHPNNSTLTFQKKITTPQRYVTPKLFVIDRPGGPDDVPSGVRANYLCLLVCIKINRQLIMSTKNKIYIVIKQVN